MEQQKINLTVNEGDPFFAHELSMNFNPTQFVFDFKCVTPRKDLRSKDGPSLNIKHNVVMVEPFQALQIQRVLNGIIEKYEEEFGKIKKPKAVEVFEKKNKEKIESSKKDNQTPSYFG